MNYDRAWLDYARTPVPEIYGHIATAPVNIPRAAAAELEAAGFMAVGTAEPGYWLRIGDIADSTVFSGAEGGYYVNVTERGAYMSACDMSGFMYGMYRMLAKLRTSGYGAEREEPKTPIRLMIQWDNGDGTVERGYAGKSIFFDNNTITHDMTRIRDYARLLCSAGYNSIIINNTNVHEYETTFIFKERLPEIKNMYDVFAEYGIRLFLAVNFAAPYECGDTASADPLDESVRLWWAKKAKELYSVMPGFGGFSVKADSEGRPGPFAYGRDHADGANMLARALEPYGGTVLWRAFVYNCTQDWRDTKTDRACAAYEVFKELDGKFLDNVILQIKNGPMDFQVREPVSPLFGALEKTKMLIEFQIAQEYTGQQRHICNLGNMWRGILNFDTYAKDKKTRVTDRLYGIGGISNIGDDANWTGHKLAQSNLYTMAQLAYSTERKTELEWSRLVFPGAADEVYGILKRSYDIFESYSAPLGIGWMVKPEDHYGPSPMGYEFDRWGTYNRADRNAVGIDRTSKGTGFSAQYNEPLTAVYDDVGKCPEELLLFFHRLPYSYKMKNGETLIQHIYNTHFWGKEAVDTLISVWESIRDRIDREDYASVRERLDVQKRDAAQWCDVINSFFYRFSGVPDESGRKIY